MNCKKCGAENDETFKYCNKCGHLLSKKRDELLDKPFSKFAKWFFVFLLLVGIGVPILVNYSTTAKKQSESALQNTEKTNQVAQAAEPVVPAKTDRWTIIEESAVALVEVDTDSLVDTGNSVRRIYSVANLVAPVENSGVKSILILAEFDCNNGTFRIVTTDGFSENFNEGNRITHTGLEPWQQIQTDTPRPMREEYYFVCAR